MVIPSFPLTSCGHLQNYTISLFLLSSVFLRIDQKLFLVVSTGYELKKSYFCVLQLYTHTRNKHSTNDQLFKVNQIIVVQKPEFIEQPQQYKVCSALFLREGCGLCCTGQFKCQKVDGNKLSLNLAVTILRLLCLLPDRSTKRMAGVVKVFDITAALRPHLQIPSIVRKLVPMMIWEVSTTFCSLLGYDGLNY